MAVSVLPAASPVAHAFCGVVNGLVLRRPETITTAALAVAPAHRGVPGAPCEQDCDGQSQDSPHEAGC